MTDAIEYIKKLENDLASMKAKFNIGCVVVKKKRVYKNKEMTTEERKEYKRKYQKEYQKKRREQYKKDIIELKNYRSLQSEQNGEILRKEKRREYMRRYREKKKEKDEDVFMECDES